MTLHANAGATTYFDVDGRRPTSYNLGGSAVLALTRETNLLFETLGEWTEEVTTARDIERDFTLTILPGIRHGISLPDGGQLVLGIGAPISFSNGQQGIRRVLLPVAGAQVPALSAHRAHAAWAALRTASAMSPTTWCTSRSSSPSAITRMTGSVPDGRMTSRPLPPSRALPRSMACLTRSCSSGAPSA